jgi:hypothetical protein
MVGALGEHLDVDPADLAALHDSLSPYSRYDFGPLATLPTATSWGARLPRRVGVR